jgi:hypothetical protein
MKLRARALGLAIGTIWGLTIFLATIGSILMGKGESMAHLTVFLNGYRVSFGGAIVGLIWGVVGGFIFGALVAWLYNILHKAIYKSDTSGT